MLFTGYSQVIDIRCMKEESIRLEVESLLQELGLDDLGWSYSPTKDKRRLGVCNYDEKTIGISLPLATCVEKIVIEETILHEIAHAIAGAEAGHGPKWKAVMRVLGVDPVVRREIEGVLEIDPWRGYCHNGHEVSMAAAPRRVRACSVCGDVFEFENILQWTKNGQEMNPREIGGKYFQEYLQVRRTYG